MGQGQAVEQHEMTENGLRTALQKDKCDKKGGSPKSLC